MNIKGRITARKILLVYFYEQYFLENAGKQTVLFEDVERVHRLLWDEKGMPEVMLTEALSSTYFGDIDREIAYIIQHHVPEQKKATIDYDYIQRVAPLFYDYRDIVRDKVNTHTISFSFDDMDLIDRVLFVLGYIEFMVIETPKEVVLNEMIELAKRYGDEKSPKLLNAIGHKVLMKDTNPENSK